MLHRLRRLAALLYFCAAVRAATDSLGFLQQSFYFDYNVASQAVPVPVTTQCETIHLTWSRGAGTGPDPTAPYFLQIYTSAFVFPFIVFAGSGLSFQVPFGPGTIYQVCMFDSNGNTGGCQASYTMIANTTATPTCQNATFPLGPLDVDSTVSSGSLSQYGWIDQCTDIQVTPKNGTPPYTFTVAPALHPPHNQTSSTTNQPMNWTVNLSWGAPFFISVVDADMNFWAYGPLHSGMGSSTACLTNASSTKNMSAASLIGSGVGGLLVGLLAGAAGAFLFFRHRRNVARKRGVFDPTGSNEYTNPYPFLSPSPGAATTHYKALPDGSGHALDGSLSSSNNISLQRMQRESTHYQIEPYTPLGDVPITRHASASALYSYGSEHNQGAEPTTPTGGGGGGGNIYVVHHDAGRAPVTVYHQDGTEVVELPPRYIPGSTDSSPSSSAATARRTSLSLASSQAPSIHDIVAPQRRPNRPGKP